MGNKIDRGKIYEKYGGHCGYCGKLITLKEMQVDHIEPKCNGFRDYNKVYNEGNLMPTCRRCNHYKRGDNLEQFRFKMKSLHERVVSHYIGKVALDYDIVTLSPFDGIFYFEKQNKT